MTQMVYYCNMLPCWIRFVFKFTVKQKKVSNKPNSYWKTRLVIGLLEIML